MSFGQNIWNDKSTWTSFRWQVLLPIRSFFSFLLLYSQIFTKQKANLKNCYIFYVNCVLPGFAPSNLWSKILYDSDFTNSGDWHLWEEAFWSQSCSLCPFTYIRFLNHITRLMSIRASMQSSFLQDWNNVLHSVSSE